MKMNRPIAIAGLSLARRVVLAAAIALPAIGLASVPAAAYISGGCTAKATDSSGKATPATIQIESTDIWHVSKDSHLSGTGHAPTKQKKGFAFANAFGLAISFIPIAGGEDKTGDGSQEGSGSLDVSAYSDKFRVFAAAGASSDCAGALAVVIDDVSALSTLVGQVSLGMAVLGLLVVLLIALRRLPE
jgi:hypothetical protein